MRTTRQPGASRFRTIWLMPRNRVSVGDYASEREVIREGLRALFARDRAVEAWLQTEVAAAYDAAVADPHAHSFCTSGTGSPGRGAGGKQVTFSVVFLQRPRNNWSISIAISQRPDLRNPAARYTDSIAFCEELATFPYRGKARDDIGSGLQVIGYKRRLVVAFAVISECVLIVGVFYGGRDYGRF